MPRRFVKNPGVAMVVLPGVGRVRTGQVLVGDHFQQYSPHLLTEVQEVKVPEIRGRPPLPVRSPSPLPAAETKPVAPPVLEPKVEKVSEAVILPPLNVTAPPPSEVTVPPVVEILQPVAVVEQEGIKEAAPPPSPKKKRGRPKKVRS